MRALLIIAALAALTGIGVAFSINYATRYIDQPGPLTSEKIVFIAPGTGVRTMGEHLKSEQVIAQPYAFMAFTRLWGVTGRLKAGEYAFMPGVSLRNVIVKLVQGDVFARNVTIPEGLTSFEIAAIVNAAPVMSGSIAIPPSEGSIMPDTYAYIRNDDRAKLLDEAQRAMNDTLSDLWEKRAPGLPFTTPQEALVLASIVEKETRLAPERTRVAGVYINRLRKNMMLQSDPTVIYAITKGTSRIDRVLYQHLEVDSPYNTYRNTGLPPTPICAPGRASIEAVLNPEVNDYLFFVADGQGGHIFAKTMAEQEVNVAKYRVIQRQERAAAAAAKEAVETPAP